MAEKQVSDYPEEFIMAWDLARSGKLELTFDTKGKATNFRHRLYGFRSKFRKEVGLAGTIYDAIELSIEQKAEGTWLLSTRPSPWREQIRALRALADGEQTNE